MAKVLPYFKWYPSDAEADDFYASLTNEELGVYHRLLNRAWLNDGIPSDVETLAVLARMPKGRFEKIWERIRKRWQESPRDPGKLVNPRQDQEYVLAMQKSENNKRVGNANASRTRSEREANDTPRAYDSVCVSDLGSEIKEIPYREKPKLVAMSGRFEEFWNRYPGRKFGQDRPAGMWAHFVTSENEAEVFACLARYLESDEVARGVIMAPEKWLSGCHADGWSSDWPKARDSPKSAKDNDFVATVSRVMERNLRETGKPW